MLCNARYREIHAVAAAILVPGTSYAAILRQSAEMGAFGPIDELDDWVAERAGRHRASHEPYGLQLASGPYLLVRGARTPDGEVVELLADVSGLKAAEAQLSRPATPSSRRSTPSSSAMPTSSRTTSARPCAASG